MSTISGILIVFVFVLIIYSYVESHSFSPIAWRSGFVVFRYVVENSVIPDLSLIGYEVTINGVIAKLIDERTCLFRREFRFFQLRTFPLLGEIRFGPKGYLVIGRLQWSRVFASLILAVALSTFYVGFEGSFFAFILILLVAMLSFSVIVERDRISSSYPKVISWSQSRK